MLCRYRRRPPVFFENASVAVMIWPLGLRPPHPWWFEAQRRGGQLVAKRGAGNVTQLPIFGRFDRRPTVTTPHQQKLQAGQIADFLGDVETRFEYAISSPQQKSLSNPQAERFRGRPGCVSGINRIAP